MVKVEEMMHEAQLSLHSRALSVEITSRTWIAIRSGVRRADATGTRGSRSSASAGLRGLDTYFLDKYDCDASEKIPITFETLPPLESDTAGTATCGLLLSVYLVFLTFLSLARAREGTVSHAVRAYIL